MDPIYVTGHRNPDTDSIVSAMAYDSFRNINLLKFQLLKMDYITQPFSCK